SARDAANAARASAAARSGSSTAHLRAPWRATGPTTGAARHSSGTCSGIILRMLPALVVGCLTLALWQAPPTPPRAPDAAPAQPAAVSLDGRWDLLTDPDADGAERGLPRGDNAAWTAAL